MTPFFIENLKKIQPRKSEKNISFRAKTLSLNTWRSGPDICYLWAGLPRFKIAGFYDLVGVGFAPL